MKRFFISLLLLVSFSSVMADTLYQATVGGYSGGGLSIGGNVGYVPSGSIGYGYTGQTIGGIPYEGANYPFGQQCCSCNNCNPCGNSYGCGR